MQPKIVISKNRGERDKKIWEILLEQKITPGNSDLLIIEEDKVGIAQIKQIRKHLSSKPFSDTPKSVVILDGNQISIDGQNGLLKTLEEPPGETIIIIGVDSESKLLPTVLSRCIILSFQTSVISSQTEFDLDRILKASIEDRFEIVEKLDDKNQFLEELVASYRQRALEGRADPIFLGNLLEAEIWAQRQVNIRAILEYLMLSLGRTSLD